MNPTPSQPVPHLPSCVHLHIEFNDHAVLYQTAARWIEDQERASDSGAWFEWVTPEERQKAIDSDSIWTCQWYPSTPNGFCALAASSYDVLMAALKERAAQAEEAKR